MKKFIVLLVALLPLVAAWAAHGASPQELLIASDAVRNPDHAFGLTNILVEYRQGKQTESSTLAIYSRADPQGGQFRSLVRYVAPARDAGKLILFNGKDMWFYDPASQASIRLSPQQRLLGQASNGDVVTVNFAKDYRAETAVEEEAQVGERKPLRCFTLGIVAEEIQRQRPDRHVRLERRGERLIRVAELFHGSNEAHRRHADPAPLLGNQHAQQAEATQLAQQFGVAATLLPSDRRAHCDLTLSKVPTQRHQVAFALVQIEVHRRILCTGRSNSSQFGISRRQRKS